MNKPPDFDQIARSSLDRWNDGPIQCGLIEDFAAQLRKVWNARGAADREAVSQESERITIQELDR